MLIKELIYVKILFPNITCHVFPRDHTPYIAENPKQYKHKPATELTKTFE